MCKEVIYRRDVSSFTTKYSKEHQGKKFIKISLPFIFPCLFFLCDLCALCGMNKPALMIDRRVFKGFLCDLGVLRGEWLMIF
jgi:hypothetical protein